MINILLCTDNLEETALFYKILGVNVIPEKHRSGPDHFSFETDVISMEIYPPRKQHSAPIILRFTTKELENMIELLRQRFHYETLIIEEITTESGKKAILNDPDGRVVEIFQPQRQAA